MLVVAVTTVSVGCKNHATSSSTTAEVYIASPERAATIESQFPKIILGMDEMDVKALMGAPDEIRPLYEPRIKNAREIGTTWWYYLRRGSPGPSDPTSQLVRVSFDLQGICMKIDHWGF